MNHRHDETTRTPLARTDARVEPLAEPVDDLIWRGGEAMVASGCFFDLHGGREHADPQWLVI